MAGELGPGQINNGGGGTVGVGGVRAPDYRDVQAPMQVDTNLPNNEAAQRAEALRSAFQEFEGVGGNAFNQLAQRYGALAGAKSGATGHPQYKTGLESLTTWGRAFNNSATAAYAVEAEAQADDAAARLRVQANGDPAVFAKTYAAVRDGVLKNAPALAQPVLQEIYNKHLADGIGALSGEQAQQQRQTQRDIMQIGVQRQVSRAATLAASADPQDQAHARVEEQKLMMLIEGGVKNGVFTQAEGDAMRFNSVRAMTEQTFMMQVDKTIADPNGDIVGLLDKFRQMHLENLSNTKEPVIFSEDEYDKLSMTAKQKVIQNNMAQALARRDGRNAQLAKFQDGDRTYTARMLAGTLTFKELSDGVAAGDITPEVGRALKTAMINRNEEPKSNPAAVLKVSTSPDFLDMSDRDIAATPGVNAADALKLITERDRRNNTWEGSQQAKDARAVIMNALKLPKGPALMFTTEQQKAASNALIDFTARMNKLDPAQRQHEAMTVAQQVVKDAEDNQLRASIAAYQQSLQRMAKENGPGTDAYDAAAYEKTVQYFEQKIQQAQRQLAGK